MLTTRFFQTFGSVPLRTSTLRIRLLSTQNSLRLLCYQVHNVRNIEARMNAWDVTITPRSHLLTRSFMSTKYFGRTGGAIRRSYSSDSNNEHHEQVTIQRFDVDGAITEVKKKLEGKSQRNLFIAHGQYFQHATDERFKVVNSSMPLYGASDEDTFEIETFLDCSMLSSQHQSFVDALKRHSDSPVGIGELDFINTGEWRCGFCFQPSFSIFTENIKLLTTFTRDVERKSYMRLYAYGLYDDFPVDEIKSVRVKLSDEPYCEQSLEIVLKDDEIITVIEKEFHETSDMSLLMVETEWAVKCAGLLCLDIKRKGGSAILELPDNLTVAGNPWVEMRHQAWVKSLPPNNT